MSEFAERIAAEFDNSVDQRYCAMLAVLDPSGLSDASIDTAVLEMKASKARVQLDLASMGMIR